MLFLTYWFVLFAAIVFALYWLIPLNPVRRGMLLVASVVFHTHFAGPAGVLPIVVLGAVAYVAGLSRQRRWCVCGIVLSALALMFYKYTRFLCDEALGAIWPSAGFGLLTHLGPLLPLAPPLAISFFVFEFIHYLYNVMNGMTPIRNPADFCLFALFWPSIVAGPVKRYEQFLPAVAKGVTEVSRHDIAAGIVLVALGLAKKLLADNLTMIVHHYEPHFTHLPLSWRWGLFAAIGLRILWDFSGYSDMAIGFARMFGIKLPANFRWPYLAASLTDFWRRWHISLSLWIRDYVYIPIGGSRHGVVRRTLNGLLAFAVCGLWHGAAWNFLSWGLYHGVGLALSSGLKIAAGKVGLADPPPWLRPVGWAATMAFVFTGWLFFFYPVPRAWEMWCSLFAIGG